MASARAFPQCSSALRDTSSPSAFPMQSPRPPPRTTRLPRPRKSTPPSTRPSAPADPHSHNTCLAHKAHTLTCPSTPSDCRTCPGGMDPATSCWCRKSSPRDRCSTSPFLAAGKYTSQGTSDSAADLHDQQDSPVDMAPATVTLPHSNALLDTARYRWDATLKESLGSKILQRIPYTPTVRSRPDTTQHCMAQALHCSLDTNAQGCKHVRRVEILPCQKDSSSRHRKGIHPPPSCSPRDSSTRPYTRGSWKCCGSSSPPKTCPAGMPSAQPFPPGRRILLGTAPAPGSSRLASVPRRQHLHLRSSSSILLRMAPIPPTTPPRRSSDPPCMASPTPMLLGKSIQ